MGTHGVCTAGYREKAKTQTLYSYGFEFPPRESKHRFS
jgi:hypothetical protein